MSMSVENSDSVPQEKTMICEICQIDIVDMDERLRCVNQKCGKWTCADCANTMIKIMIGQPQLNYPLKCGTCCYPFDRLQVEELIIKNEHYAQYIGCMLPLYWLDQCLDKHEQLAQCKYNIIEERSRKAYQLNFSFYYNRPILSIS
jgi:hypothetical protein